MLIVMMQGCLELLDRAGVKLKGKRAVVVGRSNIVGTPAAQLLQASAMLRFAFACRAKSLRSSFGPDAFATLSSANVSASSCVVATLALSRRAERLPMARGSEAIAATCSGETPR